MRGWKPADVGKRSCRGITIHIEQEEIRDGLIVEPTGNRRVLPDTLQRIAENDARTYPGIEEGLDAELIPRAKEAPPGRIPDRKRKIADQMVHTAFGPNIVGVENQLGIGRRRRQ